MKWANKNYSRLQNLIITFILSGRPISWAMLAPSITPKRSNDGPNNPGLRLYKFDKNTGQVSYNNYIPYVVPLRLFVHIFAYSAIIFYSQSRLTLRTTTGTAVCDVSATGYNCFPFSHLISLLLNNRKVRNFRFHTE